jgi:hypothetical protein
VARQRPDMADRRPELSSDPIGQPISKRRADGARDPDRPEVDAALGNHGADGDQNGPGRQHERDERERFPKGKATDDWCRPHFVGLHESDNVPGDAMNLIFERHGPTSDNEMRRLVPSLGTAAILQTPGLLTESGQGADWNAGISGIYRDHATAARHDDGIDLRFGSSKTWCRTTTLI